MQWNEAIVVIGRCKRVWTASAARAVERGVLPWICSENPVPKAETTPLKRYTRRAWDARDPESLLQCLFGQNLSVTRLRRIAASCPPASPAPPLSPLRGASRDSHDLPERTTIGLSAFCRCGHDKDPQAPLKRPIG